MENELNHPTRIKILIADDHPVVRNGLAAVLNTQTDMEVVAQARDGKEVLELFRLYQPDVAIVDLRMPEMGGAEAIAAVRAEFPEACFIMLTVYDTDEDIYKGLRAGAKAYLLKDMPCLEIAGVVRDVYRGNRHITSQIGTKLAARMEYPSLSDRELEVLQLMTTGRNNKAIGEAMGVTESTIKFHVNNILAKLGATDRTHAVVTALKRGLIQL
jgi:DNA-binding NarL/FixJ family response regulator